MPFRLTPRESRALAALLLVLGLGLLAVVIF